MSVVDLDAGLQQAVDRLAAVPSLLIALDFDGTISPVVDSPEAARALPEAADALRRLAALPGTRVALVSGRSLESLERVSDAAADTLLVGSHGVEVRLDGGAELTLTPEERQRADELREALEQAADPFDDVWVEVKPAGSALHTRRATDDVRERAERAASAAAERFAGLTTRRGKNVLEFAVRSETKGQGVERLREVTGADAVLFAGDDVTDEDAFRVLGETDLGLKVGEGDTAAAYRVDDPQSVARVLERLADRRAALNS